MILSDLKNNARKMRDISRCVGCLVQYGTRRVHMRNIYKLAAISALLEALIVTIFTTKSYCAFKCPSISVTSPQLLTSSGNDMYTMQRESVEANGHGSVRAS